MKNFTTDNLSKSGGNLKAIKDSSRTAGMSWLEEYDPIPEKDVEEAKKAWRNWVDLNR